MLHTMRQIVKNTRFAGLLLIVALVVPLLVGVPAAAAQGDPQPAPSDARTITVTGYGVAYGRPDIVRVALGVEGSSQDIMTVMEDVNTRMDAVLAALVENGVAREDIRTENFSIYQDYGYGGPAEMTGPGEQPTSFYRVTNTVQVTVRQTDMVASLLEAAVNAGANVIHYVQFDIEDRATLQSEARTDAVADARARAEELAAILGVQVGDVLRVVENQDYYGGPVGFGGGGGGFDQGASAPSLSEGMLSVTMTVNITFELLPQGS